VGNGKTIQPPLSSLGSEVTAIDVTIPSPSWVCSWALAF
jgi:hypothetical protein